MSARQTDDGELPEDVRALSFEDAMRELEEIVRQLEQGQVGLEESIAIYTRGTQLRRHCEARLRAAQERIDRIVVGADGKPAGTEPLDQD